MSLIQLPLAVQMQIDRDARKAEADKALEAISLDARRAQKERATWDWWMREHEPCWTVIFA